MAIVVTGPNNYVGIKANKSHPREGGVLGWERFWLEGDGLTEKEEEEG